VASAPTHGPFHVCIENAASLIFAIGIIAATAGFPERVRPRDANN